MRLTVSTTTTIIASNEKIPSLPTWKNMENYILQLTTTQFSTRITNVACHNYCTLRPMPLHVKSLLGFWA